MDLLMEELFDYLKKRAGSDEAIFDLLKRYYSTSLLPHFIEKLDTEAYRSVLGEIERQRMFNNVIGNEMSNISSKFKESNLKLLYLKGLPLAVELYSPPETRLYSDIDLLIDSDEMEAAIKIFREMGYVYEWTGKELTIENSHIPLKEWLRRTQHIPDIARQIEYGGNVFRVKIDVHVRIFNETVDDWEYVKSLFERSAKINIHGCYHQILELHDRIIHLLTHATKEYIDTNPITLFAHGRTRRIKFTWFYDIAAILRKYKNDISWETILNRAILWNKEYEILIALQLVERIFPNSVSTSIIENIRERALKVSFSDISGFKKRILPLLAIIPPDEVIIGDQFSTYKNLLSEIKWLGPIINLNHKNNPENSYSFVLDEFIAEKENVFGTFVRRGQKPKTEGECSASGIITWDEKEFHINITVKNQYMNIKDLNNNSADYFCVVFGTGGKNSQSIQIPFIRMLSFYPFNGKIMVWDSFNSEGTNKLHSYEGEKEKKEWPYRYLLALNKGGYEVDISIPWDCIGITPYLGKEFWFDLEVSFSTPGKKDQKTLLALANMHYAGWLDPSCYAKIVLIK